MLIDFHTHLDHYQPAELKAAVSCIKENKILTVAASCSIDSFKKNLEISQMPGVQGLIIPTFGIHPSFCEGLPQTPNELSNLLESYLKQSQIIGETGLDFYWEKTVPPAFQELVFLTILDHCNRYKKYAVIHTKGAEERIADILKDFPDAKPIIHWYDGNEKIFNTFTDRGFYQTFGCEVRYSKKIQKFLTFCPDELLLTETDNPSGEPWLCRNKGIENPENSPLLIQRIINDIGVIKNCPAVKIEKQTEINARFILSGKNDN